MKIRALLLSAIVCGALLNAGCETLNVIAPSPRELAAADCGPEPIAAEEQIRDWLRYRLKDYDSVRLEVESPKKGYSTRLTPDRQLFLGWDVVARVNAKNSFGAYAGWTTYHFFFRTGYIAAVYKKETGGEPELISTHLPPPHLLRR
jgi:hypothetical protein